jgi:hypothetical protein
MHGHSAASRCVEQPDVVTPPTREAEPGHSAPMLVVMPSSLNPPDGANGMTEAN